MTTKAIDRLIKTCAAIFVVIIAAGLWYYALGRKPKLTLSTKFAEKDGAPSAYLLDPGQVLLIVGTKATLYEMATGQQKWTANLAAAPAAAPATPSPKPVVATTPKPSTPAPAKPAPVATTPDEKPDPLLEKRVERRFAKLAVWASKLNQKRTHLKTRLQIEGFNEEAAKYHAELAEARAEAAPLHKAAPAALALLDDAPTGVDDEADGHFAPSDRSWDQKTEVLADGPTIWVVQSRHALALDRANGRTLRDAPLAGEAARVWRGAGGIYVLATAPDGSRQISRLTTSETKTFAVAAPATGPRYSWSGEGLPATPNVQAARCEFSAAGSELLQVDIRLIEKKITERQVISGDAVSDMEEADKKTTGGWASDAAVMADVLAKDAAREATGGKERTDESTYEITLLRPFTANPAASAPIRVQGRPEVFSTANLDLVVAGQTLLAFDRTNKKIWESKLAHPLAFADTEYGEDSACANAVTATSERPCLEDGERLYLFDKGFLSAFERATGKPLWRLPSIGIRKVQLDGRGVLYVSSANGTADSMHGFGGDTIRLTIKVDAKLGKVLWKLEKYQDIFVSGRDLYACRETRNAEDMVNTVFAANKAPQTRFKLYKLSTRSGEAQWEWFQTRRPLRIESEGKKVCLLFQDELQIIKSIAL